MWTAAALPNGMEIDLGSVAKGSAGWRLAHLLKENGVTSALLDLGGNIQAVGAKPDGSPWRVAIRDPEGEGNLGVVEIVDKAVVTSGGYERYFEQDGVRYWHIRHMGRRRSGVRRAVHRPVCHGPGGRRRLLARPPERMGL